MIAKGRRVSFWDDENVLKVIVVMHAQPCEYTKGRTIVHCKWNFMVCELYSIKLFEKVLLVLSSKHKFLKYTLNVF